MNHRVSISWGLVLSLAINVVLLIAYFTKPATPPRETRPKWVPGSGADSALGPNYSAGASEAAGETAATNAPTGWARLEAEDYVGFIANLRKFECPEYTIRDIIEAEINNHFEPKYLQVLAQVKEVEYWRKGTDELNYRVPIRAALNAVDAERGAYLKELLGEDYVPRKWLAQRSPEELIEQSNYGFLSPELQEGVLAINREFQANAQRIQWEKLEIHESRTALAANENLRRSALAELLTTEELWELDLRNSPHARTVRQKLGDQPISEAEFQKLFALENEPLSIGDPRVLNPTAWQGRQQRLEAGYREVLGEERFVDMKRQRDRDWNSLKELASEHELKREAIEEAWLMRREAADVIRQTRADAELSDDERSAMLVGIETEYQRQIDELIGPKAAVQLGELPKSSFNLSTGGFVSISVDGEQTIGTLLPKITTDFPLLLPTAEEAVASEIIMIFDSADLASE